MVLFGNKINNLIFMKKNKYLNSLRKNSFTIFFVTLSFVAFFSFFYSISFLKNSLYTAKLIVDMESNKEDKFIVSNDPFVHSRAKADITVPVDTNLDPVLLSGNSPDITIFYFSDFDCSFCLNQEDVLKNVYRDYEGKVKIVFKNYPNFRDLNSFSYQAARAARCAHGQNSFWDYSRGLYGIKDDFIKLGSESFVSLARDKGLNIRNFNSCLENDFIDNLILENVEEAKNLGISGMPYMYIGEKEFLGFLSREDIDDILNLKLND